jgi:hypothetical protein
MQGAVVQTKRNPDLAAVIAELVEVTARVDQF